MDLRPGGRRHDRSWSAAGPSVTEHGRHRDEQGGERERRDHGRPTRSASHRTATAPAYRPRRRPRRRRVVVRAAAHVRERQAVAGSRQPSGSRSSGTAGSARQRSSTARVWCDTPRWRSRGSTSRHPGRQHRRDRRGPPPAFGGDRRRHAAVAERGRGPDDPRPDRADDGVDALGRAPAERRVDVHALDVAGEAGAAATATSSSPRSFSARTVSDSATGSAPPASWTYATRRPARAPRRRARAGCGASSRRPAARSATRRLAAPPPRAARPPAAACTAASSRARRAPPRARARASGSGRARRIRPSRARARAPGRSRPRRRRARPARSAGVRDARDAVDLEAHEPLVPLEHRGDRAAPKRQRHRRARASRRPSARGRRARCARRACGCRSSRSRG